MNGIHWKWALLFSVCLTAVPQPAIAQDPAPVETDGEERVEMRRRGDIVEIGRNVVVEAGETCNELVVIAGDVTVDGVVERDVVVLGGTLHLRGRVRGEVVVVAGSVKVDGEIGRALTVVLGDATFGENARVRRDAVILGPFEADPGALFESGRFVLPLGDHLPGFGWLKDWVVYGGFYARPMPMRLVWPWVTAGVFAMIYILLALLFPKPIMAGVAQLETRPFSAFFTGLLVLVLLGPLLLLLLISVVGIVVVPFLLAAMVACFFIGKATMLGFVGHQLGQQFGSAILKTPVMAVLTGSIVFTLIYLVPVIGMVAWGIMTLLGIGAICLAATVGLRREEPAVEPVRQVVSVKPAEGVASTAPVSEGPAMPSTEGVASIAPVGESPAMQSIPEETLSLPRVGFWLRFWALALDAVAIGVAWTLVGLQIGALFWLVWLAYHVGLWTWRGTTLGGIVLGLKIVRVDGSELTFPVALVRALASVFSAVALGLGFFWAGWTRNRQSWHDRIAGTAIVRMPKGMSLI